DTLPNWWTRHQRQTPALDALYEVMIENNKPWNNYLALKKSPFRSVARDDVTLYEVTYQGAAMRHLNLAQTAPVTTPIALTYLPRGDTVHECSALETGIERFKPNAIIYENKIVLPGRGIISLCTDGCAVNFSANTEYISRTVRIPIKITVLRTE